MTFYDKISKFIKCTINGNKYERHLTKEDVYDATKKCPTCGSLVYRKPVCKIQSNPSVEFLYCPTCTETEFKNHFIYTLLSYLFKFPAYIEIFIRNNPTDFIWNFVAGWEIVIRMN